jgi:hypothetical protein
MLWHALLEAPLARRAVAARSRRPVHSGGAGRARPRGCRGSAPEGLPAIDREVACRGGGRSTVKNVIREAARLGLLTVEERQITGFRNGTNVLRIVSPEWLARLRLARGGIPLGLPLLEGGLCGPPSEGGQKHDYHAHRCSRTGANETSGTLIGLPTSGRRPQPIRSTKSSRGW